MRSSNPALRGSVFQNFESYGDTTTMTVTGTAVKTLIAIMLALLTAGMTWFKFQEAGGIAAGGVQAIQPLMIGGGIVGFMLAIATIFKPTLAAYTTPLYALAEGCVLGGLSALAQSRFPTVPIVFQACCLTFGTLAVMLFLYQSGIIKVTNKLRMGITSAVGAIALVYIASIFLPIPYIHSAGPIGIGISLLFVGVAAACLLLDFDLIDKMAKSNAPKYMEWYGAFALMTTLVWLYIELLLLLQKLYSHD
ncbi:MAG: Bax inhibitor-1/YccA family protein [Planctomycetaceae bacterium]